jgi:hypothetical protein
VIVGTAVTVVVVLISLGLVVIGGVWLSWYSPAALSEEDAPDRPWITDGVGRPAGPDAEAMGVLDRGVLVTGPPPPGGVPTDAPRARPARRRWRRSSGKPTSPASRSRTRAGVSPVGAEPTSPTSNGPWARTIRPSSAGRNQAGHPGTAGADLSKLAPSDIVVALRGLERRYRELFEALGKDESADDVAPRRAADGWSAIDHIVAATQAIAAADRALGRVLTAEAPTLQPAAVDPTARSQAGRTHGIRGQAPGGARPRGHRGCGPDRDGPGR